MIVVDMEASGLDIHKHAVVSIGAIDFLHPTDRFYMECRVWDGATFDPESLAVNGFTPEQITDPSQPSQTEVLSKFASWMRTRSTQVLAGQNPSCDRDFINAGFRREGIAYKIHHRILDLHSVIYMHCFQQKDTTFLLNGCSTLSLDAIGARFGLPPEARPHHGLRGALYECEVFGRYLYGRPYLPEFADYSVPADAPRSR